MIEDSESRIRREAADWWSRLRTSDRAEVRAAFEAWRTEDPAHDAAYLRLERRWDQSAFIANAGVSRSRNLDLARPLWTRPGARVAALAAAIFLAVGLGALVIHRSGSGLGSLAETRYVTAPGEVRIVTLANGAHVVLDGDTAVALRSSSAETAARLERGRARFASPLSGGPRFVVAVDDRAFTSPSGEFDIDVGPHLVSAVLWRGSLDASDGPAAIKPARSWPLRAGRRVSFVASGEAREEAAPRALRDWTQGMLSFEATRLADAVDIIDRYCRPRIEVADDLADLRLTGGFRARDCAGFTKTVTTMFHARVVRVADGTLRIVKKP
ncbi:DUF4880 domain-containing protein [Sphingomonas immobilis]|uniref:DUF4880 domain-containing protein n=1 Tax=Sphingomonas immobilis TaxID=3063997 RepID=A0ABT9A183_9SPHN|nr:DUF4880 domain-containing protein [Sphingomonas sp. CA1-15]MDO7843596.1 DUF4880 domain-containing protein [Sphingomonas sp. CA1-15]